MKIFLSYIQNDNQPIKQQLQQIVNSLEYNYHEVYCYKLNGYQKSVQKSCDQFMIYYPEQSTNVNDIIIKELRRAKKLEQPITLLTPSHKRLTRFDKVADEIISYSTINNDINSLTDSLKLNFQ